MSSSLEAKIVVLGSQGVGKTSLVQRYVKNTFHPASTASTVGASFLTKRVLDSTSDTTVRLQIWDTAGQERFRSISKLYYRGANAAVLCYDVTDERSFEEMGKWMLELKRNLGDEVVLHIVGTKSDVVSEDPSLRRVPFERCIAYVAENLYPPLTSSTPPPPATLSSTNNIQGPGGFQNPDSKRSSAIWGQEIGWDCCHEISAKDGEGVEEVFRVITRKLVEQRNKRVERELALEAGMTPGFDGPAGYFDAAGNDGTGSFRVGHGDKRRSWLGFPQNIVIGEDGIDPGMGEEMRKKGKCC